MCLTIWRQAPIRAHAWLRLGGFIQALTRLDTGAPDVGSTHGDPWALLELLRPVRYVGMASQAEAQGVRTEAFVAIAELR